MKRSFHLHLLVMAIFVISCNNSGSQLQKVYVLAEENKNELKRILVHYKDDSLKLEAAKFLLENMFHSSVQSSTFEKYRHIILNSDSLPEYDKLWLNIGNSVAAEKPFVVYDAKTVTADYLIRNIDQAFYAWENAPWYDQIDFGIFCNYILPYRVLDEPVSNWREVLKTKYGLLIEGIKSPKEAFDIIHRHIVKEFKDQEHKCQYTPDVIMLNKILEGKCSNECIYIISALRSLGIPAAYDLVFYWANYSINGHSWVTYGADTFVQEKKPDSYEALKARYNLSAFRHRIEPIKKRSKVYRHKYRTKLSSNVYKNKNLLFFNNPFLEDVSVFYSLPGEVEFHHGSNQQLFLCTFVSIKDWRPVIRGETEGGITTFKHIGSNITYLPVCFSGEKMVPIENPFILYDNGIKKTLSPDTTKKETVILRRKYVLFSHWIGRWNAIIGSGIDVSNDPDFRRYERLYHFVEIPDGIVRVQIASSIPYRYVRFQAPSNGRPDIAEMRFYGVHNCKDTVLLKGDVIHKDITKENALKAFDSDYSTYTQTPVDHYWFGLDLGTKDKFILNNVEFCMRHDMNMIEVGDNYELFYYDYGWRSLGSQVSTCDSLVYSNVPSNSLLWLRNHTKGKEERIFTYEDGRQVWW